MKIKLFYAFAVCLFAVTLLKAQNDSFVMPPKVFPVLKENYVSANSDEIFTVGDVTGDIGSAEALYLPKPFYPGEARRDGAAGKIYVQITIDEKGSVASARSTDGHPALRKAAEDAARASKFRAPAAVGGDQAARAEGWLVYNFAIAPSNWIKVGYELAFLHTPWVNQNLAIAGIKNALKTDWSAELETLSKIDYLIKQNPVDRKAATPVLIQEKTVTNNGAQLRAEVSGSLSTARPEPNPEQIALTQNLIASLQSRLAGDEIAYWQFNLAFAILQAMHTPRDRFEPRPPPEGLRAFLRNAPPSLPGEYKTELKNLIELLDSDRTTMKNFDRIRNSIIKLQKLKN